MSFIVTFIAAVFVFSAVIAIHEFGHFMVAKLCGVQVNEFSIGMGPVLCKRVRKGTQYSIRALPVGGFVALEGEESPESKQAEERSNPSAADGGSSPDRGALGIARNSCAKPENDRNKGKIILYEKISDHRLRRFYRLQLCPLYAQEVPRDPAGQLG